MIQNPSEKATQNNGADSSTIPFLDLLPQDILFELYAFLDLPSLGRMASTAKKFSTLNHSPTIWHHKVRQDFSIRLSNQFQGTENYFKALIQEKNRLVNYYVLKKIDPQTSDTLIKEMNLSNSDKSALKVEVLSAANAKQVSAENLEAYFSDAKKILKTILSLPPGFLTQEKVHLISRIIGKEFVMNATPNMYAHNRPENQLNIDRFETVFGKETDCRNSMERELYAKSFFQSLLNIPGLGCQHLVEFLLHQHPELPKIIFAEQFGTSFLHAALSGMNYDTARYLINKGSDVNLTDSYICADDLYPYSCSSPLLLIMANMMIASSPPLTSLVHDALAAHGDPRKTCPNDFDGSYSSPVEICSLILKMRKHPSYELAITVIEKARTLDAENSGTDNYKPRPKIGF